MRVNSQLFISMRSKSSQANGSFTLDVCYTDSIDKKARLPGEHMTIELVGFG